MKRFTITVRPNARAQSLELLADGSWRAEVRSPPAEGRANAELIELVARHFGVPKRAVVVERGARGRTKRVSVDGA